MVTSDWKELRFDLDKGSVARVKAEVEKAAEESGGYVGTGGDPTPVTPRGYEQTYASGSESEGHPSGGVRTGVDPERRDELEEAIRNPKTLVRIPPKAWRLKLADYRSSLDEFAQALLSSYDLYLCRFAFVVAEGEHEEVERIEFSVGNPDVTIYRMWPTAEYQTDAKLDLTAKAQLGVSKGLEFISPITPDISAGIVWTKSWSWTSARTEAFGEGDVRATWRMHRSDEKPWAGDNECFVIEQVKKGSELAGYTARCLAKIRARWWKTESYYTPWTDVGF